jgi:predicted negative regulator of RcsB-dependent stress response
MAKQDKYTAPRQMVTNPNGMVQQTIVDDLPSGQDRLDEILEKYDGKKKLINSVLIGLAALIIGYFGYKYFVQKPNEEKAADLIGLPSTYMMMDSMKWMVNGRNGEPGAKKIADQYAGTDAGNLATYMSGIGYLKQGEFKNAIKYLEQFDGRGTMLTTVAAGSLGDAYWEDNQLDKATAAYEKAGNETEDFQFAPVYLQRASMIYESQGKTEQAIAALNKIKKEFPQSSVNREIDRHLARLGVAKED